MTYLPDFSRKSTVSRAKTVLNFVELYVKKNTVVTISSTQLRKHFGNTSDQRPGKYMLELVLETVDTHYNFQTGKCMKYRLRPQGVAELKRLINDPDFVPTISYDIEQQLQTGNFDYTVKSDRQWNPIQHLTRVARGSILNNHGYCYNYDIEACAPTLLLQQAQSIDHKATFEHIQNYIDNRSQVRAEISSQCGISDSQAKTVINAMFQGARLSCWSQGSILRELDYNYAAVRSLQTNPQLCKIKQDIKHMWDLLRTQIPQRTITDKNGKSRRAQVSSKEKSAYYRALETQVGKQIQRVLKKHKIKYLWIHDGWASDQVIDPAEVVTHVRRQTGFVIKLDWTKYE